MKQTVEQAVESATACYHRAKAAHDRLDALSRQRSLTHIESKELESAIRRMDYWGSYA